MSDRQLIPQQGGERQLMAATDQRPTGIPPGMEQEVAGGEQPASPEEENDLQQMVTKIDTFIHGRKSRDAVIDQLNQRDMSIPAAVGRVAAQIVGAIAQQASATGKELGDDVLQWGGAHAVEELMEVGATAKFFEVEKDSPEYDEMVRLALLEAYKAHGEQMLKGPNAEKLSADAANYWASQAAQEVDDGTADPEFLAATGNSPRQLIAEAGG